MLVASTISRIFSEYTLHMVCIRRCWAAAAVFIFQVKIASSKFFKPIADGPNSRSTSPVNGANLVYRFLCTITFFKAVKPRGELRLELGVPHLWNYVELFWNSLDNAPSSIVLYLETEMEVEVGVHDIRSRFTPRVKHNMPQMLLLTINIERCKK